MARSYGKLLATIWLDDDWRALPHHAQWMYMTLLSQPRLTLAGSLDLMPGRWAALAADTHQSRIEDALDILDGARFVIIDHETAELVIRTLVRHDLGSGRLNINLVKGMWAAWAGIASPELRRVVVDHLPDVVWERYGSCAPDAATRMRRSGQLEPPVETDRSNQPSEPPDQTDRSNPLSPLSSLLSPLSGLLSPAAAAERSARELSPDSLSTTHAAAVDIHQTFTKMLTLAADREMMIHPTRNGRPERHRASIIRGKRTELADQAYRILHADPDITPADLLAALEPGSDIVSPWIPTPSPPAAEVPLRQRCDNRECSGGFVTEADDDGRVTAVPCPTCNPTAPPPEEP